MKALFLASFLMLFLSACGGGGGSSAPVTPVQDPAVWDQGTWDDVKWQ